MSARQADHQWIDEDGWRGDMPLSIRWLKIDEMAKRMQISVIEDEMIEGHPVYIAFRVYRGRNIYKSHVDPAEASLEVLKEMVRLEDLSDANP
jgi:hypothetical protein